MNKIACLFIVCIFSCLKSNYLFAQNQDNSFLIGAWVTDTSNTLNNKTGVKKPDFDFIWSKFVFNLDGTGKISWNYHTDGGGYSYFTWKYSGSDSVLKITSNENKVGYWKFIHCSDSCIDMVNYGSKKPKPGSMPKSQEERKYVKNEILAEDFSPKSLNEDPIRVYQTEKLQFLSGNKYFTGEYHITVNLYDITGRQVRTLLLNKTVPSNTIVVVNLDFKEVQPGIYILSISDGNTVKESVKIERK